MIELSVDMLGEIFSYLVKSYSFLRVLSKSSTTMRLPFDGWDSLIAQGVMVEITKTKITWFLTCGNHKLSHSRKIPEGDILPAEDCIFNKYYYNYKVWKNKGDFHRGDDLPAAVYGVVNPKKDGM